MLVSGRARDQARALYVQIRAGSDPAEDRRADRARPVTFAEMAAAYIADLRDRAPRGVKRGRLSTAAEFERLLNRLGQAMAGPEKALESSSARTAPGMPSQSSRAPSTSPSTSPSEKVEKALDLGLGLSLVR
jgi:hypothetical protein